MKRLLVLFLSAAVFICGCGCAVVDTDSSELVSYDIYYARTYDGDFLYDAIISEPYSYDKENFGLQSLLSDCVYRLQTNGILAASPEAVELRENNELVITLSDSFSSQSELTRTISAACLCVTLCQYDMIDCVTFMTSDGVVYYEMLSPDRLLLTANEDGTQETDFTIYFPLDSYRYVRGEERRMILAENSSFTEYVFEELLEGPMEDGTVSLIPSGTALLSINTVKNICYINLSSEFYARKPESYLAARALIYSVVNTMTQINDIDAVQFLINGLEISDYSGMELSKPISACSELIWDSEYDDEKDDISLYMRLGRTYRLTEVPLSIEKDDYHSYVANVLEALIATPQVANCVNLIPRETELLSAEIQPGAAVVTFSSEFIDTSYTHLKIRLCVYEVVASLANIDGIESVTILVDGDIPSAWRNYIGKPLHLESGLIAS